MSKGPSCKSDRTYFAYVNIHLPTDPGFRDKHTDVPFKSTGRKALDMWIDLTFQSLFAVGFVTPPLMFGALLELVNRLPVEDRLALADGLIQGTGLSLVYKDGELLVDLTQKYDAIGREGTRTPQGIIVPGHSG